jgi:hypothetical protein
MRSILAIPFALAGIIVAGLGVVFFAVAGLLAILSSAIAGE